MSVKNCIAKLPSLEGGGISPFAPCTIRASQPNGNNQTADSETISFPFVWVIGQIVFKSIFMLHYKPNKQN